MANYKFPKSERLNVKDTDELFANKYQSFNKFPIRVVFAKSEQTKVGFSIAKKLFKRANDRNKLRRRMKEAYRLNKELLVGNYSIMFIYLVTDKRRYDVIESGIKKALTKISKQ